MKEKLQDVLAKTRCLGCDTHELIFAPPAEEQEVAIVEEMLKLQIPDDFRAILRSLSAKVQCTWVLPDDFTLPNEFRGLFCGNMNWGLDSLKELNDNKDGWIREVFPNPGDSYDKIWHNKFVFQEVGNGDFLSIDLSPENTGKIIYLSHDDGEGHGYTMANSFTEFLARWVQIGCVGAEDWQWLPFVESKSSGIDPECPNAILWRKMIGL
ncbi:SMI1/KNR4 family protein [Terrimonas sp. NA20]|uniref:SMI1/KNR4 family protein n=1 Tax=Terrimonas ginsenosidimutans TaxID=2908004 RepID=A0ABS9KN11_9BACT|nr:SMI1/KNR4 family protein [Terrimonas ginsenosidimutans]MCG2613716.1 SMI1/KNR4 family protein [Terrimonas ginsenosidimutans]